jgi:uncharacterized phage protein (predicted DNA packaging)
VKNYLRAGDAEDDLIQSLITSATAYIKTTTGKTQVKTGIDSTGLPTYVTIDNDELFCLAVKQLVSHWYDNRGVEVSVNQRKTSYTVDALVNHIAMCGDYV